MEEQTRTSSTKAFLISIGIFFMGAIGLILIMKANGYYASGHDAWGHLFKGELMYENLKEGRFFPLYTPFWYNGIQPYRYWAPLPYYILGLLQLVAGGDIEMAYYFFAGFSFFVGGIIWVVWGKEMKRMSLGIFMGCIWFFLPENYRVFFCEGNIPRMVTSFVIPYLVYFIWRFIRQKDNKAMLGIIITMSMMTLSHVMIAAMMGVGTFIFLFFYAISKKEYVRMIETLAGMILSFLVCGLWLIPALSGGLVGMNQEASASVMSSLSYNLSVSLNPLNRLTGVIDTFYYGLSIVVISVIGILLSKRREKAGYYTVLIILAMTTTAALPILSKLPLSQLFWMMRFATIVYAFFFWALLAWDNIRTYFCIILMSLLLLDCFPSLMMDRYYTQAAHATEMEVERAKEVTKQRVALLDLSSYGSYPSYGLSKGKNGKNYTYGWAWQGASTASNIVMINTALEAENYVYLFDRCLELGDDTILVRKALVGLKGKTVNDVIEGAALSGYKLYQETDEMYTFHRDTPDQFGVKTEYEGLGIGSYASNIELDYPVFTTGKSIYIDDYSYEELATYQVIYLSGFNYYQKEKAENLLRELSEVGVKIIIDVSHMPIDNATKRMTFLDVTGESITFEEHYPTLNYKGESIIANDFQENYDSWHTQYIQQVDEVIGTTQYDNQNLTFLGTNKEKNIIFMGLNLYFHALETDDEAIYKMLSEVMGIERGTLPKRTLVPLKVIYRPDSIHIAMEEAEEVNTTIAFQDNFVSDTKLINKNNLLYINDKVVTINFTYPYLYLGGSVSLLGMILSGLYMLWLSGKLSFSSSNNETSIGQ